jgi:two-component system, OmpR family, response regulator ResD
LVPALRALVCEDDAAIRTLLLTLLGRQGFEVDNAANGHEALAALSERDYDLIVLDLMMPKSSGYDVLSELAATRPEILCRIVVLTAAALAGRGDFPYKVAAVVIKPFDVLELSQLARNVAATIATP